MSKTTKKTEAGKKQKLGFFGYVKRFFMFLLCLVLICLGGIAGANIYVRRQASRYILKESDVTGIPAADCVLVLGASVWNKNTPSPMLADRLDEGVTLYELGVAPKLLMSGDHGTQYYNEVEVMKKYALDRGVPSADVFMDHAGFSTYESMYRAKEIFGAKRIVIVTQQYHLYRAVYIARMLGLDAYGVATVDKNYGGQTYRDIREYLAICKDIIQCMVEPASTVLGDSISLTESGDVTNDGD